MMPPSGLPPRSSRNLSRRSIPQRAGPRHGAGRPAVYAYCTNYLIDVQHAVIVDVEPSTAVRQAEVTAAKTMIERVHDGLDLWPERLIADTGYGSAEMLDWLVHERGSSRTSPVFDKSKRTDGTFSREDFTYDHAHDTYRCPAGKILQHYRRRFTTPRTGLPKDNLLRYRASKHDCDTCPMKDRCCPNAPARKVLRSIHEGARDMARDIAKTEAYQTSRYQRKKVEMPSQAGQNRCLPPQTHPTAEFFNTIH